MMAEGIDAQINREKNGVEDGYEIANSNDTPVVVKGAPKIPSRYLSSRIPSCHDYCKYGIQHSAEAKPRSAAGKKFIASGRKTKASEEIVISVAGMKKSASGLNDSPTLKLGKPETTMKDQLPKGGIVPADKTLMSFVETNVSMDHNPIDIKKEQSGQPSLPVQESSKSQTSREVEKSRSPFGSGNKNTSEGRIKEIRASPVGGNRRSVPTSSPLSSKRYVKKSSSTTSKTAKNLKEGANLKIQKNVEEVIPEPTSSDNSQEKILNVDEPTTVEKSMEPTLACDPPNLSLVSPSLGEKSSEQDSEKISECGSPASSKKSSKHATHGIHPTKSLAPYPQSSGIKDKRHTQKTTLASSSLSASSRRIFRHGDQGNHQTKSTASFPSASGIEVNRKAQNTKHNTSSDPSSLSRLRSSRRTFKHADNENRLTTSLKPSPLPSGVKVKRRMQHIIHSVSSSSSFPSATESSIPAPNSFLGKQNGATFKSSKRGNQYPGENVKVGFKIRPKMSAIGGAGDKVIPARKLSFRRGKVIELQPQDNVPVPRRLKFRPARLLSDTEREKIESRKWIRRWKEADKGESNDAKTKSENVMPRVQIVERNKRRNFGRKVVDGSKIDGSASGSQQVVLRHQNLLGKEVTRRLYNNVIEETATKLAELRQSKVKALVGAFETVISLDSPGLEATPT